MPAYLAVERIAGSPKEDVLCVTNTLQDLQVRLRNNVASRVLAHAGLASDAFVATWLALANPGVAVPTDAVTPRQFAAYKRQINALLANIEIEIYPDNAHIHDMRRARA